MLSQKIKCCAQIISCTTFVKISPKINIRKCVFMSKTELVVNCNYFSILRFFIKNFLKKFHFQKTMKNGLRNRTKPGDRTSFVLENIA